MEKSAKRLFIELNKINLENRKNPNARKFIIDETPFNEDDDNAPPKTETDKDGIYYNVCGRILPTSNSYNKSAFKIKLRIPTEFPLKPPQVEMQTSIYHPNIGSQGKICLPLLKPTEGWKITCTLFDVIDAVIKLIDDPPRIDEAHCKEIADQYTNNRPEFDRKVAETIEKNMVPRQ